MIVLVLNAGSSSLKFQLIETGGEPLQGDGERWLARGMVERVGGDSGLALELPDGTDHRETRPVADHRAALAIVLGWLTGPPRGARLLGRLEDIDAVGHRVVHGGERFRESVLIDPQVLERIEAACVLAPLHNPHNLKGIRAARAALGEGVPHAAVFDTAFHLTLPEHAFLYAIPYALYERRGIRRYGFHGTSHRWVTQRHAALTGRAVAETRLVSLHLGNGCSACAIAWGESVDTSMGFTPLEGLVMGTRSGDLDPALIGYIADEEGLTAGEVITLLNRESGLRGLSGETHDVRDLTVRAGQPGGERAALALRVFAYRARKYVGAYLAAMGGADAVVFTGGIGENAAELRRWICEGLEWVGLELDPGANSRAVGGVEARVSADGARLEAWVIPTNEELLIARDTARLVGG
jgi:acetate kinase